MVTEGKLEVTLDEMDLRLVVRKWACERFGLDEAAQVSITFHEIPSPDGLGMPRVEARLRIAAEALRHLQGAV